MINCQQRRADSQLLNDSTVPQLKPPVFTGEQLGISLLGPTRSFSHRKESTTETTHLKEMTKINFKKNRIITNWQNPLFVAGRNDINLSRSKIGQRHTTSTLSINGLNPPNINRRHLEGSGVGEIMFVYLLLRSCSDSSQSLSSCLSFEKFQSLGYILFGQQSSQRTILNGTMHRGLAQGVKLNISLIVQFLRKEDYQSRILDYKNKTKCLQDAAESPCHLYVAQSLYVGQNCIML